MEEIESLLTDYQKLQGEVKQQKTKRVLLESQSKDSAMLYESMQYKTAIVGVISILATISLFQIVKK